LTDLEQRGRALDPAHSFIVQAPAGSGKTGLLTQRFLRLLGVVDRLESIVAVTFTRKAAAEMRERVFEALQNAAAGTEAGGEYEQRTCQLALEALAQSEKRGWNLLADPSRLQVYTIDALCALLTRQMPVVSGFGGQVEVVEDATALYRAAARRTLQMLTEDGDDSKRLFRELVTYFDNNTPMLEDQIVRMLEKRDQWTFLKAGEHPKLTNDFCQLLEAARKALEDVFRESGTVDFSAITRAAIRALGPPERPSDLLYALDYRIQHLLVDEFQDTSRAQYDLLEALTAQWSGGDEHSLFLVGDPMQSIYRFREAEVSLFLDCWAMQLLGGVHLERLVLNTNFRCTPEILGWVQDKFSRAMLDDDVFTGSVRFRPSSADRASGGNCPQCHWFLDDDGSAEAARVVEIVREAQHRGSVAVLVRSRTHVLDILPAFREAGIAYEAIDIDRLADQQHVIDVISLTRAILHVADRLSWLACLRAPWCGLSLADLSAIAENEPDRTVLDLISDPSVIARLSPPGRACTMRVHEVLSAAVANAGRTRLRSLVESTWLALGGPAVLRSRNQLDDVNTVLDLIDTEDYGGAIVDFSILNEKLGNLFAKPASGTHRVQVMTIYQAKGLEFDTVVLPQLARETQRLEKELLIWTEELDSEGRPQFRIAAMPQSGEEDPDYRSVRDRIKEKEEHELKRVFYVACTRAKNDLYLLASRKTNKDCTACHAAKKGTFLHLIWDSVKPEFDALVRRNRTAVLAARNQIQQNAPASVRTFLSRLGSDWRLPVFDSSVRWQPGMRAGTASSTDITFEWVKGNARHIGTVVHAFLNRIAADGLDNWNVDALKAWKKLIASELLVRGVTREDGAEATEKVIAALANTVQSSRGRWILGRHAEARSEYAIRGRIKDEVISGVIDRVFRDEHGRLWIIDYKTGEHKGGNRDTFLNEEQRRYRDQLENYATLISRIEEGPVSLGLYFPLLDAWREWEFAREAALTA
jgi:ATP-dependent helicase/nuclease subunit A